jgi:hypothetical protein
MPRLDPQLRTATGREALMVSWPELTIRQAHPSSTETEHLFRSYAFDHPKTIEVYDLGENSDPNEVTPLDLGRMLLMNPRLTGNDAANLLKLGNSGEARWDRFPLNATIADADPDDESPDSLWLEMQKQYDLFRMHGLANAKITKLLHLKRPNLFPIVDSYVRKFYKRAGITNQRWRHIREDVISNSTTFAEVRTAAAESTHESVRRLEKLTDLRLHDIATWSLADGAHSSS